MHVPTNIWQAFSAQGSDLSSPPVLEKIGHGLINHSWKLTFPNQAPVFLQQLNQQVFKSPQQVQDNYLALWHFWKTNQGEITCRIPAPIQALSGHYLEMDNLGLYWRAFEFIPDSCSYEVATQPEQARETALVFAGLTSFFNKLNPTVLKEVIPGFHNLSWRMEQCRESIRQSDPLRKKTAADITAQLMEKSFYPELYNHIVRSSSYRKRIMHHDAKISNILFHQNTGSLIGPVDFDTMMPGYFFSDIGDMIRSMVSGNEESGVNPPVIRKEFYDAILEGYQTGLGHELTTAEQKHLPAAGPLLIFMQAIRFLTDYLNGDTYYQTSYPDQNLHRARNQLLLLEELEQFIGGTYSFSL